MDHLRVTMTTDMRNCILLDSSAIGYVSADTGSESPRYDQMRQESSVPFSTYLPKSSMTPVPKHRKGNREVDGLNLGLVGAPGGTIIFGGVLLDTP